MQTQIKDIYWLAGLIEGDGCFSVKGIGRYPTIKVSMADRDVVARASILLRRQKGDGTVRHYRDKRPTRKDWYEVAITGKRAAGWMMTLYPLMGERRKAQITKHLAVWRNQQ